MDKSRTIRLFQLDALGRTQGETEELDPRGSVSEVLRQHGLPLRKSGTPGGSGPLLKSWAVAQSCGSMAQGAECGTQQAGWLVPVKGPELGPAGSQVLKGNQRRAGKSRERLQGSPERGWEQGPTGELKRSPAGRKRLCLLRFLVGLWLPRKGYVCHHH